MRPRQLLFAAADQHHRSIKGQEAVFVEIGERFTGHGAFRCRQIGWRVIDFQGDREITWA